MKPSIDGIVILMGASLFWNCQNNRTFSRSELSINIQVQKISLGESSFQFDKSTCLLVENKEQESIASQLSGLFEKAAGWKLQIHVGTKEVSNQICFKTDLAYAQSRADTEQHSGGPYYRITKLF